MVLWPLAEVKAVVGFVAQCLVFTYLPTSVIPSVASWQSLVYVLLAIKVQRYLAAGRHSSALKNHLAGKIAVVTGANTGIGFETAAQLAKQGATVYLACRSEARAFEAMKAIRARAPTSRVKLEFLQLDLSDYDQIREAAAILLAKVTPLGGIDILINNAGVMDVPGSLPHKLSNGHESHIGINHLGTILFTELVKSAIISKPGGGRIVMVASQAQRMACKSAKPGALFDEFIRQDMELEKKQAFFVPYGCSKAGNVIYAQHLARKHYHTSPNLIATALHPGCVASDLVRSAVLSSIMKTVGLLFIKNNFDGAQTSLACALERDISSGQYYCDAQLQNASRVSVSVRDEKSQEAVMAWSFKVLGLPEGGL